MWWKQVCRPVTASQLGGALLIKKGCREGAEDACLMYLSERGCVVPPVIFDCTFLQWHRIIQSYNAFVLLCLTWVPGASRCQSLLYPLLQVDNNKVAFFSYRWRNVTSCQPPKIICRVPTYCYILICDWCHGYCCTLLLYILIYDMLHTVTYCYKQFVVCSHVLHCLRARLHTLWARGRIAFRWLLGGTWPGDPCYLMISSANGFQTPKELVGKHGQTYGFMMIYPYFMAIYDDLWVVKLSSNIWDGAHLPLLLVLATPQDSLPGWSLDSKAEKAPRKVSLW